MKFLYLLNLALTFILFLPAHSFGQSDPSNNPDFILENTQTHNKFSSTITPAIRVPSGSIVEIHTQEPTLGQIKLGSGLEVFQNFDTSVVHPLTGPVYVEGAEPGDVLKIELLRVRLEDYGWAGIIPTLGLLTADATFFGPSVKTFDFSKPKPTVEFLDGIHIPLRPFPGVIGVAPATEELLSTIPPRANGGNLDDPNVVEGTTVYLPVFVEGGLISMGDVHASQGMGEVCGTALESRSRIVYSVEVLKDFRQIKEPQYETPNFYAVTAFGESLELAVKKATGFMVSYLIDTYFLQPADAYILASLTADLKISQVVNAPNVSVSMHIPKKIFEHYELPDTDVRDEPTNKPNVPR